MTLLSRTFLLALAGLGLAPLARAQQASGLEVANLDDKAANLDGKAAAAPETQGTAEAQHVAQIRIVRLSDVRGQVLLDRRSGEGLEATFANLPIVQGNRLVTHEGFAEVEFEDNSTLRIAPESEVEFKTLNRDGTGATMNTVKLVKGTLYVSLIKTKGLDFHVQVSTERLDVPPGSHLRLDVYPAGSELAVFQGKVPVTDGESTVLVGKEKALKFGGNADAKPTLVRDDEPGLYDTWDKSAVDYHAVRVSSAFAGAPYSYGLNDLSYYGSFANVDGCGNVWRPYLTSAAWNPYGAGMWTYFAGAGYSWVSPYPWGWTPYHSGSWVSCGSNGYGWQPGNGWTGLSNAPVISGRPARVRPPLPVKSGQGTLVSVGASNLRLSRVTGDRFEFAKDSAGLGIGRGAVAMLEKVSSQVNRNGAASLPVERVNIGHDGFQTQAAPGPVSAASTSQFRGGLASRPVAFAAPGGRFEGPSTFAPGPHGSSAPTSNAIGSAGHGSAGLASGSAGSGGSHK